MLFCIRFAVVYVEKKEFHQALGEKNTLILCLELINYLI